MDSVLEVLGGLLVLVAIPLAVFLAVVIPVWAMIDLLKRDDDATTRVLWGLLIVFCLGGLGSILYALVGSESSSLRRAAIIGLIGVPILFLGGALSLNTAEQIRGPGAEELDARGEAITTIPDLPTVDPDIVGTFVASRPAHGAASYEVGVFDLRGPDEPTLHPVNTPCEWVALDDKRQQYYCTTWRGVTVLDLERDSATKLPEANDDNFSHLAGITHDGSRDRVLVTANTGAGGFVFAYTPSDGNWQRLFELGTHARALAASSHVEELYVIPEQVRSSAIDVVRRYNLQGAFLGDIVLTPPLPLTRLGQGSKGSKIQLVSNGDWLVVVLSDEPERHESPRPSEIFAIERASGKVHSVQPSALH